jgi:anti-anti-sigma factor
MNLSRRLTEQGLELIVDGRLDAYWADHLSQEIGQIIHEGIHHVRLHLGAVQYISSAGIRVLLQFHKQLSRIDGSFLVSEPSAIVRSVIQLTGLEALLVGAAPVVPSESVIHQEKGIVVERIALDLAARMRCRLVGTPTPFPASGFTAQDVQVVAARSNLFGIGLGALGSDYEECRSRFGEWMMVDGAVAYLPSDRAAVPDYAAGAGAYHPVSQMLYGLCWEGQPAWQFRFDAQEPRRVVSLSEILQQALSVAGTAVAGVVLVAETASLVGAALRKPPTEALRGATPMAHPEIRNWLRFTPERAFPESVTLAVGVVAREAPPDLMPWLRPLGGETGLHAHFHAAAFSYHPLPRGRLDLRQTVSGLFEQHALKGMLHLLTDDREIQGAGESELTRGACWIGPIDRITRSEDTL